MDVVLTKPGGSRPWQGDPVGRMCDLGEPAVRRGLGGSQVWVVVCAHQRAGVSDSPEWRTILWHLDVLGVCAEASAGVSPQHPTCGFLSGPRSSFIRSV